MIADAIESPGGLQAVNLNDSSENFKREVYVRALHHLAPLARSVAGDGRAGDTVGESRWAAGGRRPRGGDEIIDAGFDRLAARRQQFVHRALVHFLLEGVAHHPVELERPGTFVDPHVAYVDLWIADAPAHVPVNDHPLFLCRQGGFRVGALQRQQALVDVRHILERRRQLEVEAGLGDHFLDLSQRIDDAELPLVHHEEHGAEKGQGHQGRRDHESDSVHLQCSL